MIPYYNKFLICVTISEESIDELFDTLDGIYKSIEEAWLPFWSKKKYY